MNKYLKSLLLLLLILSSMVTMAQNPIMEWTFDSQKADTIEGLYREAKGVVGSGVLLDGFTTRVVRKAEDVVTPKDEFTVDAWVALGNYPWNWCPIITTQNHEIKGYRLMVGPFGEASMQVAIGDQWVVCTSAPEAIPLRDWMHVTGTYKVGDKIELYINGSKVKEVSIEGAKIDYTNTGAILGMTATKDKPSHIHRTGGTMGQYFGIDGIIDEVKVYDSVLSADKISQMHSSVNVAKSELEPRHLPEIMNTGKFKAYYTKLKYFDGWDNVWPVAADPDIVVCFEETPIRLTFWRGIRYGASWVSENGKWMTDQSVDAWSSHPDYREGCFEHMQDRHCRFSHVRIIENTDARVVVHWRYTPTSCMDRTWMRDEKTGWECWIDEYYYIYPDGSAIRKVMWNRGSLGPVRQFQETLALLGPGEVFSDLVDREVTTVSDYDGKRGKQMVYSGEVPAEDPYKGYTIQRYNYKSENKPYICFEPGNVMNLRDRSDATYHNAVGCNHFPVGQARCDGRTTYMSDRPSHATSWPISDPIIHNGDVRNYWCALYGMTDKNMDELQSYGRSWAYAPSITVSDKGTTTTGFDRSERCYQLEQTDAKSSKVVISVDATVSSPSMNPAFYIKNWGDKVPTVLVDGRELKGTKIGIYEKLDGSDLIVYIPITRTKKTTITIQ